MHNEVTRLIYGQGPENCGLELTDFQLILEGELGYQQGGLSKQSLSADRLPFDNGVGRALALCPTIHVATRGAAAHVPQHRLLVPAKLPVFD